MGSLVKRACEASVLRASKGISRSFIVEKKMVTGSKKEWIAQTDGVNLKTIFEHRDILDVNRIKYA